MLESDGGRGTRKKFIVLKVRGIYLLYRRGWVERSNRQRKVVNARGSESYSSLEIEEPEQGEKSRGNERKEVAAALGDANSTSRIGFNFCFNLWKKGSVKNKR